jgi:hypothetical protein
MTYNYNLKANKNGYVPFLFIAAIVLGALSTFLFLSTTAAVIITVLAVWAAVKMSFSLRKILSSRIETYTEGFNVFLSDGTKLEFEYKLITHAGFITNSGFVFAYEASLDRIVQLPKVFINFEDFVEELKENTTCYKDYTLEEGQTIIDWLKADLGITEKEEDSDNEISETTSDNAETENPEIDNTSENEEN